MFHPPVGMTSVGVSTSSTPLPARLGQVRGRCGAGACSPCGSQSRSSQRHLRQTRDLPNNHAEHQAL
ncbi:hypothetical protein E2C01_070151 [Portunus trituberculatus]|uniref:Uncharacterized protein n=1 Tax=Portunus trituberculatus TaxID=210409 RepID=A0A5B7I1C6_PORTR|nr:hypothetical protein [Portunus trituberculatus]